MNTLNDESLSVRPFISGATSSLASAPARMADNPPPLDKLGASGASQPLQMGQEVTQSELSPSSAKEVAASKAAAGSPEVLSEESLDELASSLNNMLEKLNNYMRFQKDDVTGRNIYSLVDAESKEVIKQFPSDEFLNVSRRLVEYLEAETSKDVSKRDGQTGSIISNIV